jgi:site-specific DNA recombinase
MRPYGKYPSRPLKPQRFYKMLGNPFYVGLCRHETSLYQGNHTPLLTIEEFKQIQQIIGRGEVTWEFLDMRSESLITSAPRKRKHSFTYTGLIRCTQCQGMVTASQAKGHVYYHCSDKKHLCNRRGIREESIETQIQTVLETFSLPKPLLDYLKSLLESQGETEEMQYETIRQNLEKEIAEKEKRQGNLLDLRIAGLLDDDAFQTKRLAIESELIIVRHALQEHRKLKTPFAKDKEALSLLEQVRERFSASLPDEKRLLLHSFSERLEWVYEGNTPSFAIVPKPRLVQLLQQANQSA